MNENTTVQDDAAAAAGRRAYYIYGEAAGGTTHNLQPLPGWDELSEKTQGAWIATAAGIRQDALTVRPGPDAHRVTLEQLGVFVGALGIEWTADTLMSITMERGTITVVRARENEDGHHYMLPGGEEQSTVTTTIAIVNDEDQDGYVESAVETVVLHRTGVVGGNLVQLVEPGGVPMIVNYETGGDMPSAVPGVYLEVPAFPAGAETVEATMHRPTTVTVHMNKFGPDAAQLQDAARRSLQAAPPRARLV